VTARGVGFLDCPVSGTSSMVERGDGIFFVGGERALYERWRPVLESVLARAVLVGTVGQAMTLKLVANLLVALHSAAAAQPLTLARKAGLDLGVALDVLNSSAASSAMLKVRGPMIVQRDFPAQMKLELFMKDIHLMQEAAASVGASLPFTDLAERLYDEARKAGHGAEDLAVVATALEGRRGQPASARTSASPPRRTGPWSAGRGPAAGRRSSSSTSPAPRPCRASPRCGGPPCQGSRRRASPRPASPSSPSPGARPWRGSPAGATGARPRCGRAGRIAGTTPGTRARPPWPRREPAHRSL